MDNLPQITSAYNTGRYGVTLVQQILETKGWIFRRQDGEADFGVDAEVEIINNNKVTGNLFKVQIKASEQVKWQKNQTTLQVQASTFHMWQKIPLPTILVLADKSTEEVFWTPALAHNSSPNSKTVTIRFNRENSLTNHGLQELEEYLASWFQSFDTSAFQYEVPYYHQVFVNLKDAIDRYDDWCTMGKDDLNVFQRFYGYLLRFRLKVGLSNQEIPPFEIWRKRDAGMWNGDRPPKDDPFISRE